MKLNILFLSLLDFNDLNESNIYTDLLNEFVNHNHSVSIISPMEKRKKEKSHLLKINDSCEILKLKIGNITKTNFLEKGISTILLENILIKGIKKFFSDKKFDLVIYTTPPVTFANVISFLKSRDHCKTYLLLKDIFPQNAVDLETISNKGLIYKFFRSKEKKLYNVSDYIGTMSKGNSEYLKKNNNLRKDQIIEVNPNSIYIQKDFTRLSLKEEDLRKNLNISEDKIILLYGGNLGAPQGIDFLLVIIEELESHNDILMLIVGSGTEYKKIQNFINLKKIKNTLLYNYMPKKQYENLERIADIGLIFLDKRFTIPNIPSRLLGYMKYKKPILAATDNNTDLKEMIKEGSFGLWSEHGNINEFIDNVNNLKSEIVRKEFGHNGYVYLKKNFNVMDSYHIIMNHFSKDEENVQR